MEPNRPSRVIIRQAYETDLAAYRELRLQALRDHPEAFGADYMTSLNQPMEYWQERLRKSTNDQTDMFYFAVDGAALIGMTGINRGSSPKNAHSAVIYSVYVRPEWRSQGIAGRLIDACLDWGREHGVVIAKLGVWNKNTPAIRCYERCGFEAYCVEPMAGYVNGVYLDELYMARKLV